MELRQLRQAQLIRPHEEIVRRHHLHIGLALEHRQHVQDVVIAESLLYGDTPLRQDLSQCHKHLLCGVQHLILGQLYWSMLWRFSLF